MNGLVKATGLLVASLLVAMLNCGGEGTPTIVVDSTADTDSRDGVVTLREALLLASGELAVADLDSGEADNVGKRPGAESSDRILFDSSIFAVPDGGIIFLTAPLPALSAGSDTIDGSQGSVIVDGGDQSFHCLTIDSSQNLIKGLHIQNCLVGVMIEPGAQGNVIGEGNVISRNDQGIVIGGASADNNIVRGNFIGVDATGGNPLGNRDGVHIHAEAQGNLIGGNDPSDRNIISGNRGVGITIRGSVNIIEGNYIGTDASGAVAIPNGMEGVWIAPGAQDNIVGGSTDRERNVISGNDWYGLSISGSGASGNMILGNYIGIEASGRAALANRHGLVITKGPKNNVVGGSAHGEGNVISGNVTGVLLDGADTSGNTIIGNYIGTDPSGDQPLGNSRGIWIIEGAHDNTIGGTGPGEGNVISFSRGSGVFIKGPETVGNTIRGNSIHNNGGNGIDNVDGGNKELEPPTVTSTGPITGSACSSCTIDVYSDSRDEGAVYEGSTVAEGDGGFTFEGSLSGPIITATATDGDGNTSAFSQPLPAVVQ